MYNRTNAKLLVSWRPTKPFRIVGDLDLKMTFERLLPIMSSENMFILLLSLTSSLPIGILAGLYSGLIITRYSRFTSLRNEVIRIVRSINYMAGDTNLVITGLEELPKTFLISSDLLSLHHRKAADTVLTVNAAIWESNSLAERGQITSEAYGERYLHWQKMIREMAPNKAIIFSIKSWHL